MITCARLDRLSLLLFGLLAGSCAAHPRSTTTAAAADGTSEPATSRSGPVPSEGVVHDEAPCLPLASHVAQLAGDGATDCGVVPPETDRSAAWACVEGAQASGAAFKVVLLKRGKDATLAIAWTRNASGAVTRVNSDSDPTGSHQDKPAHATKPCPGPQLRSRNEALEHGELFECADTKAPERRCRSHAIETTQP